MLIEKRIPFSYIFNQVKQDIFNVLLFSMAFHIIKLFFLEFLPPVPIQLPTILGTSISLILAFNLNQSYDRWWEARKVWGSIVNDSRTFVLQLQGFINKEMMEQPEVNALFRRMALRQIAWCYSLGQSLRKQDPMQHMDTYLVEGDISYIKNHLNKPYSLMSLHIQDLKDLYHQGALNAFQQVQLDDTIKKLIDSMGRAERIKTTVFPITYRIFMHFFIYLFLIILSGGLVHEIGFFEIPVLTLIATTFFMLEKTAKHMQDPFDNKPTDTAVTAIARTIEINIKEIIGDEVIPETVQPNDFYIM